MSPTSYLTAPSRFASITLISVKVNLTLVFINYLKNVLPYPNIKLFLTLVKLSLDISLKYLLQTQKTVGLWSPFFLYFYSLDAPSPYYQLIFLFIITYFKKSYPIWVANDGGVVLSLNHPWAKYITLIRNYNINQKNRNQFWLIFHNRYCNLIKLSIAHC